MLERDLLLNGTVAILLACLAWQFPAVARRFGRVGLGLFVGGVLLPFLDTALFHLITADRIELLSRPPLFAAPLVGLALIGALAALAAFVAPPRRALGLGLGLAAGFGAHVALAALTPAGWPLLAPFSSARASLPMLPTGHPPLLLMLFALVALGEGLARRRQWIASLAVVLTIAYGVAGAVQFVAVTYRARALHAPQAAVHVYPDGAWLARWQVVVETPERYELRRQRAFAAIVPDPKVALRWNDQALFLKLLGDPVVNRYYFHVFHHPVVRLEVSGGQITLLMQELEDQSPLVPGPTFYSESDLTGRNRFYQLQRFN